ncbi:5'-3' exonuclease [Paucibacter soli]|uniref:5'-3' exonuclease n=1 Tax=Paucibacter soli TaxID=3133433 RepID=UPI00309C26C4
MNIQHSHGHKLLIADGTGIVRRVNEAVHGDIEDDRIAGVIRSTWQSLLRGIREHEPTHFLAAFDHPGKNWRHDLFAEYKLDRSPMPESLSGAMPSFMEHLNNSGLRAMSVPGVEADDTISTLATKAAARGFEVIVLTSDKDMLGLLDFGVQVYDHFGSKWRDHAWVLEHFGVSPSQMTDLLALMGDETDGIPGVAGVGVKKAAKLLSQYGTLDAILENAHLVAGKLGESIRASADVARLSRALATMKFDLLLGIAPRDLELPAALLADLYAAPEPRLIRTSPSVEAIHQASEHAQHQSAHPHDARQIRRLRP